MKNRILFLLLISFSFSTANAQIFKKQAERAEQRAKNRAENKAQNKIDQKVDETVDKAIEGIGSLFKKKNNDKENTDDTPDAVEENDDKAADFMAKMMGNATPADLGLPNAYAFSTKVDGTMTQINKKGKEDIQPFTYLYADDKKYMGFEIEQNDAIGIMDFETNKVISVMKSENMATVIDLQAGIEYAETYADDAEETWNPEELPEITKTGKTKMIAGYQCEQYLINGTDMEGDIWRTPDLQFYSFMNMGADMNQLLKGKQQTQIPEEYAALMTGGYIMEGTFIDKEDGSKTIMEVHQVRAQNTQINLTDYRLMDTSGLFNRQ